MKDIIIALLGGGFLTFIVFFVQRRDEKKKEENTLQEGIKQVSEKLDKMSSRVDLVRRDCLRNQLITMMNHYSSEESKILSIAETYFITEGGDWYVSDLFTEWCKSRNVTVPQNLYNCLTSKH